MREILLHPKPLLSVLIPHLPERKDKLNRLLNEIYQQAVDLPLQILIHDDEKKTTGEKRNELVEAAIAPYVVHIDDDDSISDYYFNDIFPYLDGKTDCVGFIMEFRFGDKIMPIYCSAAVTVPKLYKDCIFRWLTHIQVIRKELCVPFRHITKGEDVYFSKEMSEKLKHSRSKFINKTLYYYNAHVRTDN